MGRNGHRVMFQPAPWVGRSGFGEFLNGLSLTGEAVEVGVHRGDFTKTLLDQWKGRVLHCIDPYLSEYDPEDPIHGTNREEDYKAWKEVVQARGPLAANVAFYGVVSKQAVSLFQDGSLDFVYIDACHQYEAVRDDLSTWWPKLKPGGVLAGHDIVCVGEIDGGWGKYIQRAAVEFGNYYDAVLHLVIEPDNSPWSYYFIR